MDTKEIPRIVRELFFGLKIHQLQSARAVLAKMIQEQIEQRNREAIQRGLPTTYHRDKFNVPQNSVNTTSE